MRKLSLVLVCLLVLGSLHPERSWLVAGSSKKSDLLGKIRGDSGRTGIVKQTINFARGSSSRHGATRGGSPDNAGHGGGAMIPIYTAGSANRQNSVHHSGAGHGWWSCSILGILATGILISFCILM